MRDWEVVSRKPKTQQRIDFKIKEFESVLKSGDDHQELSEELRGLSVLMSTQQVNYVEKLRWDYGV